MKKARIIALITTITLVVVVISLFFFNTDKNEILSKVPMEAKSVLLVDVLAISTKLLWDDLGKDEKDFTKIAESMPDSLADIDWENSGLSLLDEAILFTMEDSLSKAISLHFLLQIADNEVFNSFMDSLAILLAFRIEAKENIHYAYLKNPGLVLAWNNAFVTGMISKENSPEKFELLKNTLQTKKESSILADTAFTKSIVSDYHLLFYSKPYNKKFKHSINTLNTNLEYTSTAIIFKDGELLLNTNAKAKKGSFIDRLLNIPEKDFSCFTDIDSSIATIQLRVNPGAIDIQKTKFTGLKFNTNELPFLQAWNGQLNMAFMGIETVKSEYVSYEYDDEFNKVETKQIKLNKVWDIQALLGFNEKKADSVFKIHPHIKKGKDTLAYKGSDYVLQNYKNNYLLYHKSFAKPKVDDCKTTGNAFVTIDCKKLLPILKEQGIKAKSNWLNYINCDRITLRAERNKTITISSSIYFMDNEKNALFSLIGYYTNYTEATQLAL